LLINSSRICGIRIWITFLSLKRQIADQYFSPIGCHVKRSRLKTINAETTVLLTAKWLNWKLECFVDNSFFRETNVPGLPHCYTSLSRPWLVAGLSKPGVDPRPVMCDFWWKNWQWYMFFLSYSAFLSHYYFTNAPSTHFIHVPSSLCSLISAIGGNVKYNFFFVSLSQHLGSSDVDGLP